MKINDIWYGNHPLGLLLAPLGGVFCVLVRIRQNLYKLGLLKRQRVPVPVIVVGNITAGGTGKTPLVIWLAQFLQQQGFKPGIVSRGYGGKTQEKYQIVYPHSDPYKVGDEPILLAEQSGCAVVVARQRFLGAQYLVNEQHCNIIICDDGLQHYALYRDIEIAVLDDIRRFGNRRCLPAGPLREPVSRLEQIHFLVTKGAALSHEFSMQYLDTKTLFSVSDPTVSRPLLKLRGQPVHAIAGIGHPDKFFNRLRDYGLKIRCHEFTDHAVYTEKDIQFPDDLPIIMTEKDAVKCKTIANARHWYLPIKARLPVNFGERLLKHIEQI